MAAQRLLLMVAVLALLAVSAPAVLAGDVIAMPTADTLGPGQFQINYIYWDTARLPIGPGVRDYTHIGELFVGVTDWLELDYLYVAPQRWDLVGNRSYVHEVNAYITLMKETPDRPSLVVGATNLFGMDWLPSSQKGPPDGDTRISPFIVSAYNVVKPVMGANGWFSTPLVRVEAGWGSGWHEEQFFGAGIIALNPQWSVAMLDYQAQPAYLLGYKPAPGWDLHAGWDQGEPLFHVGYTGGL